MSRDDNQLQQIPNEFICPIVQDGVMSDPVFTADGHTYERAAIDQWFGMGHRTSPLTGEALTHTALTPNIALKKLIADHHHTRAANPVVAAVVLPPKQSLILSRLGDLERKLRLLKESSEAAAIVPPMPSAPPTHSLFFSQADQAEGKEKVRRLLKLVAHGDQFGAEALIKENTAILHQSGNLLDPAGREFKGITAFQYALWALDWHMWTMIQEYLPCDEARKQLERQEKLTTVLGYDAHFDFAPIIQALNSYKRAYNTLGMEAAWNGEVGYQQSFFPAHVANEYCRPDLAFSPKNRGIRSFEEVHLPRILRGRVWNGDWWSAKYNANLDKDTSNEEHKRRGFLLGQNRQGMGWAVHRGWADNGPGPWEGGLPTGCITLPTAEVDCAAMIKLSETRLKQYNRLENSLSLKQSRICLLI